MRCHIVAVPFVCICPCVFEFLFLLNVCHGLYARLLVVPVVVVAAPVAYVSHCVAAHYYRNLLRGQYLSQPCCRACADFWVVLVAVYLEDEGCVVFRDSEA